jgi:hypothetical protein
MEGEDVAELGHVEEGTEEHKSDEHETLLMDSGHDVVLSHVTFAGVDDQPPLSAAFPLPADLVVLLCKLLSLRDAVTLLSTCVSLRRHAARPALWFALLQRDFPFVLRSDRVLLEIVRNTRTARMQIFVSPRIDQTQFRDVYAKVHAFVRKLGHPPFVPVVAVLHVVSRLNRLPRAYYRGILELCEGAPFEVELGDSVTPELLVLPSSDGVPHGAYHSCCLVQSWTFPLLARLVSFFGGEQPLVPEGGSGVQSTLGNKQLRLIQLHNFGGSKGFRLKCLASWRCSVAAWQNIFFYVSQEELARNAPPGQCVTLAGRKAVQPLFNFFVHSREK